MKIVIAGFGYLGKKAAALLRERGHDIIALTRSADSAAALSGEGWDVRACDIADPAAVARLGRADAIVHCAASGAANAENYRTTYVEGCRNLVSVFHGRPLLFTSSTSVYSQIDGSIVTEDSPALPQRESGQLLLEAEKIVLDAGGSVLRLAAIYGPARSVLLQRFLLGQAQIDLRTDPPATPDGRWINQIHRDDAAAAILHVLTTPHLRGIFNVADSHPMTQREIYTELARRFGRPLPPDRPAEFDRKRGWTNKQVSNARLRSTGWLPSYPCWFDALDCDPSFVASIASPT